MRAVLCEEYGLPDRLVLRDVPSPKAAPGELVITVKAAGVNFPDVLMIRNLYQHRPELPFVPGYEISGIVKEVGDNVNGINVGDSGVAIIRHGGFAEEVVVKSDRFWRISPRINHNVAAALPVAYGTSCHALQDRANIQHGENLLVTGAAGGVGLAAVQLGKLLGARVVACASSDEKLKTCRRFGADQLINYGFSNLRDQLRRLNDGLCIDVALDPVGGSHSEAVLRSMAPGGRFLVVGFASGEIPK